MLASGTWFLLEGRTNAYLINQSEKANAYIYIIYTFNTYARFQWEHKCIYYMNHPSAPQRVCTVMPALKSIAKLFKRCAMCASRIMIIGGAHHVAQKLWRFPSISELYRCKQNDRVSILLVWVLLIASLETILRVWRNF